MFVFEWVKVADILDPWLRKKPRNSTRFRRAEDNNISANEWSIKEIVGQISSL